MASNTQHDSDCGGSCPECDFGPFTRNAYWTGKLMLARDFTDEQRYFMEKQRHHNQTLHGSGVACGLKVVQHSNPACQDHYVLLEPGSAVDCCGRDILVTEEDTIDLRTFPALKALFDQPDGKDHVLQFRLCYRECPTEEVPVLYDECGCDDSRCAPNRILESYAVDIELDPAVAPAVFDLPALTRTSTVSVAGTAAAVLDEANARLFVMSGGPTGAIYQMSTSSQALETSFSLGGQGLAMALSVKGKQLYVVVGATPDTEVRVFDVSGQKTLANGPATKATVSGSGLDAPALFVTSSDLLLAAYPNGKVYAWTDVTQSPTENTLSVKLTGAAASSDAKTAWVSSASGIQVLDLAAPGLTLQAPMLPNSALSAMAVVRSTGPDLLVAGDQTHSKLLLIDPAQPNSGPLGSISLDAPPVAIAVAPGGAWAYVALQSDSIQVVDLARMRQGLPSPVSTPFPVGPGTEAVIITGSGRRLYVPYSGDPADDNDGGVAVVDIADDDCTKALYGPQACPTCGDDDCVVLATVRAWQPGRKLLDQVQPPPAQTDDAAAGISRIDNVDGRKVLASTQTLQGVIECLMTHGSGGTPGSQGPPGQDGQPGVGAKGDPGKDGVGLDTGITRIVALSWEHAKGGQHLIPITGALATIPLGLVIQFSRPVRLAPSDAASTMNNTYIFEVERPEPQTTQPGLRCRCPIAGSIIPVDITPATPPFNNLVTAAAARPAKSWPANGIAFVVSEQDKSTMNNTELFVTLRGNSIVDDENGNAIDAEFVRATLPTGDRRKATKRKMDPVNGPDDLPSIQGGRFESWFSTAPKPGG